MVYGRYSIPPIAWQDIVDTMATAEDALARLDERVSKSPIGEGWAARSHFLEAQALMGLEGELVLIEDLVLHDARMDAHAPSHELTKAHSLLRGRRRLAQIDVVGVDRKLIDQLHGRSIATNVAAAQEEDLFPPFDDENDEDNAAELTEDDDFLATLRTADDLLSKTERSLDRIADRHRYLIYDEDWDEEGRMSAWLDVVARTNDLPPTLAAVIVDDAWSALTPLQHAPGMGRLMAAATLRSRAKTRSHLALFACGLRTIPYAERRGITPVERYLAGLRALTAGAREGAKNHEAWMTAKTLLERKLAGRRSTSRLPELISLLLSRPLVSSRLIAAELDVSRRAARDLVADLGLREITGRGRFRAWSLM